MKKATGLFVFLLVSVPAVATRGEPATTATSASSALASAAAASASASSKSSKAPPVDPGAIDLAAMQWPRDASTAPTTEQWASVKKLSTVKADILGNLGSCDTFALKEWVRVVCSNLNVSSEDAQAIGAVWGVAGTLDDVKANATLVGTEGLTGLMHEGVPTVRNMASSVDITFPMRQGHAVIVEVVGSRWSFEDYNDNFFTSIDPGIFIEASWALGENAPTLLFSGAPHR